jgi:hypothetical protein
VELWLHTTPLKESFIVCITKRPRTIKPSAPVTINITNSSVEHFVPIDKTPEDSVDGKATILAIGLLPRQFEP